MQALAARERLVQATSLRRARTRTTSTSRSKASARRRSASASAATARPAAARCSAATRSPTPTSTAPASRSRTSGSPRAPRASASAGSPSTAPTTSRELLGLPDARRPGRLALRRLPRRATTAARARGRRLAGAAPTRRLRPRRALAGAGRPPAREGRARRGRACRSRGAAWLVAALAAAVEPGDAAAALARPRRLRRARQARRQPRAASSRCSSAGRLRPGAPPPSEPRAGILVFAADHGVAAAGVSLYPARVGAQVAAAAARGETAIGVLARALGAELVVADVGLSGPTPPGVRRPPRRRRQRRHHDRRRRSPQPSCAPRSRPATRSAASSPPRATCSCSARSASATRPSPAALLAALSGARPRRGLRARAPASTRRGSSASAPRSPPRSRRTGRRATTPLECLRRLGGLELAALVGALLGRGRGAPTRPARRLRDRRRRARRLPCSRRRCATTSSPGHRSAEPAHALVLTELGLEPLLDLRLRLGEASGAALALPLIGLAARLQREMRRFAEAGVDRAQTARH